jgi:hypothetical protein
VNPVNDQEEMAMHESAAHSIAEALNDEVLGSGALRSENEARVSYQPPRMTKKRSVARVTLFSGSGASGTSGLTSA